MKITHIDHINLTVENLKTTCLWYERVFGFVVVEEGVQDEHPWCIMKSGKALLCMYEAPGREFEDRFLTARQGRHGVSHFAFRIEDKSQWEDTVRAQGIEVHYGGAIEWPHSTSWYVADPTGYEIEVALWKENTIAFGPT